MIEIPSEYNESGFMPISRELIEDGRKHMILNDQISLDIPIHLMHGIVDQDILWQTSYKYLEKVESKNTKLSLIKCGDHRLSSPEHLSHLANIIKEMHITLDQY